MIRLLLLSILIAASSSQSGNPLFRSDYTYLNELKAFYKYHSIRQNWTEAVAQCSAEGAQLLIPQSKEEIDQVFANIKKMDGSLYIGIHDSFSEGEFITLNGVSIKNIYINWSPNEPNNANDNEHCVVLNNDGTYNDGNCATREFYICKKSAENLGWNAPCDTFDFGYKFNPQLNRCYKFHTIPMTWFKAFGICRAEESDLAIINSEAEDKHFVELFAKYPVNSINGNFDKGVLHLGFNELLTPGAFLMTNGKPISESGYDKWASGQPDNYQGVEHCGTMFRDGLLNDVNCNSRALFICEKTLGSTNGFGLDITVDGPRIEV